MKWLIVFAMLLSLCTVTTVMAQDTLWTRTFGGDDWDEGRSVIKTTDGGFLTAGRTASFGAGGNDFYLVKTDINGDVEWTSPIGGADLDMSFSVVEAADGGYVAAGLTSSYGAGGFDAYIIKTDDGGVVDWSHDYGGTAAEIAFSMVGTDDGGYAVAGITESFGLADWDFYLLKLDADGDTAWARTYGGWFWDMATCIRQTSDNGYIIGGNTKSFGAGLVDMYLVKVNANGDTMWTRTYGGAVNDSAWCVAQTSDGGYILTGFTQSYGDFRGDLYLVKTNSSGQVIWEQTYGETGSLDIGTSVQQTADGGYIIAGYTESYGAGGYDVWLIKTDENGDTLWTRTYGGTANDKAYHVQETPNQGLIVTGYTQSFGAGSADVWLLRTEGLVSVDEDNNPIPDGYILHGNYPNPFNTSTVINFELPEAVEINLDIYNILGQQVETLINCQLEEGSHSITWDASSLTSGIYFYKLTAPNKTFTGRMTMVK